MSGPEKPRRRRGRRRRRRLPRGRQPGRAMSSAVRDTAVDLAKSAFSTSGRTSSSRFRTRTTSRCSSARSPPPASRSTRLAIAALGAEALWLLYAPDSKRCSTALGSAVRAHPQNALLEQERAARMTDARRDDVRARVQLLVDRQQEINRLAAQNPSFTGDLLRGELVKTDKLVDAFIDMAVTCARYEQYLESRWTSRSGARARPLGNGARRAKATSPGSTSRSKNLAVILEAPRQGEGDSALPDVARGQLDLIENSFQLIADQIVTMQSPQELSGQLNDLLDGVESIEQTAADTERCSTRWGSPRERSAHPSRVGRRSAPPLSARRGGHVHPSRQRLRHHRPAAAAARR
jgi:hypothetical protein